MKPRTRNARTEFSPFLDVVVMKSEFEGWCFIDRSLWVYILRCLAATHESVELGFGGFRTELRNHYPRETLAPHPPLSPETESPLTARDTQGPLCNHLQATVVNSRRAK